ncbi:MAG TPA: DUF4235 domain-containing protein [Gemmatimonadaceae bacterium]|nr:DUF4235 domain-containing protein [Gemmatimonadaceae bacterium]
MNKKQRKATWMIVGAATAILTKTLLQKALVTGWQAATDNDKPPKPEESDMSWRDAVLWTASSALVLGLGQLAAKRGAVIGWQAATGKLPPA